MALRIFGLGVCHLPFFIRASCKCLIYFHMTADSIGVLVVVLVALRIIGVGVFHLFEFIREMIASDDFFFTSNPEGEKNVTIS